MKFSPNNIAIKSSQVLCFGHLIIPYCLQEDVAPRGSSATGSLLVYSEVSVETLQVYTNRMILQVSFNLTMSWNESRATYINLKKDSSLNILVPTNLTLWMPSVSFANTEDNDGTTVDHLTSIHVVDRKQSHLKDLSVAEHGEIMLILKFLISLLVVNIDQGIAQSYRSI